jgi:hypothetical protein
VLLSDSPKLKMLEDLQAKSAPIVRPERRVPIRASQGVALHLVGESLLSFRKLELFKAIALCFALPPVIVF